MRTHHALARVRGKQYQWIAVEEADGLWTTSTFHPRTFASYIAHTHGISYAHARQLIRLARQLRDAIPQFGLALRAGTIGPDQVQGFAATALTSPTRIAALAEQVEVTSDQHRRQHPDPADENTDPADSNDAEAAEEGDQNSEATETMSIEEMLLDQARHLRPDQVRRLGRHFARVADPEADDRGYRRTKEREYLELARTLDGWHLSAFLTEENGRLLRTAIDAVMTPPAPDDQRTGDQRRAQALADLAHLVLNQGLAGTHASVHPHLGVLINPHQFQRLLKQALQHLQDRPENQRTTQASPRPAHTDQPPQRPPQPPPPPPRSGDWDSTRLAELAKIDWATRLAEEPPTFDDGTGPVPPDLLRRLATCGDSYRVLFSPDNEVINHGRTHRLFTPAQRRALIARDKGCTWPGCTAPPSICESHHARIHWADGGPTNLSNGALLCYHHHALVDARSITMTRTDGTWTFTRADGTTLTNQPDRLAQEGWTLTS